MKNVRKSKKLNSLDRQLDHWQKTHKEHSAKVALFDEKHKHDMDWFDLNAYQNMIYGNKNN